MAAAPRQMERRSALVLVDVQNDFVSGSLAVPDAQAVIGTCNRLRRAVAWSRVALTKDWHPEGHVSFHSTHARRGGPNLFDEIDVPVPGTRQTCPQVMWPDHCVQGTRGAELCDGLVTDPTDAVIVKGTRTEVDSYSGFYDNMRLAPTELSNQLREAAVTDVYIAGLALDYCVGFTALDAASLGYRTYIVLDGTRAVAPASEARMLRRLALAGVRTVHAADVESGKYGPRADAADYLDQHGVRELFERLCASLVLSRPDDVRGFLVSELEGLREAEREGRPAPALFDEADAASVLAG